MFDCPPVICALSTLSHMLSHSILLADSYIPSYRTLGTFSNGILNHEMLTNPCTNPMKSDALIDIYRSLSLSAAEDQTALTFATVFVIVWCGAGIVTVNAALLGGKISFFQSVCVLGYCICPINIASLVALSWNNSYFKLIIAIVSFFWATRASVGFMAQLVQEDRRMLGVYPVILFYLVLTWMVVCQ